MAFTTHRLRWCRIWSPRTGYGSSCTCFTYSSASHFWACSWHKKVRVFCLQTAGSRATVMECRTGEAMTYALAMSGCSLSQVLNVLYISIASGVEPTCFCISIRMQKGLPAKRSIARFMALAQTCAPSLLKAPETVDVIENLFVSTELSPWRKWVFIRPPNASACEQLITMHIGIHSSLGSDKQLTFCTAFLD